MIELLFYMPILLAGLYFLSFLASLGNQGEHEHYYELVEKRDITDSGGNRGVMIIQRCTTCADIESETIWEENNE